VTVRASIRTGRQTATTRDTGANVERRYVRIGEVDIHYQVAGQGPPVVLVHGLSGSTRWWARNVGPMARSFRVHIVDLIGFGRSRGPHPFVLGDAATHLTRWMDQIEVERASIIGHSMGGFIAADLAAEFPDRVDRLVLVDAAILPSDRGHARQAVNLFRGVSRLPVRFLPILMADAYRAGPSSIRKAARELTTADLRPKLSRIEVPTLVIWGEHDTLVPRAIGEEIRANLPNASWVVLEGAGHNPMWDRADAFNRVVVEFLSGRRAT
jgi:pimeloyl-ACP methyl ester carboxylesterase